MTLSTSAVAVCCCSDSRQIVGALLHLVEQPRVLDGDHGLVGEGLDQLDLLVGERLGPRRAPDADRADRARPPGASARPATCAAARRSRRDMRLIVRVRPDQSAYRDVDRLARSSDAGRRRCSRPDRQRMRSADLGRSSLARSACCDVRMTSPSRSRRHAVARRRTAAAAFSSDRVEHRLQRRRSSALMTSSTSAVAVCCSSDSVRSSVRWLQLVEQPRVLDGDDGLVGEGRHQLDLLVGERAHLRRGRR